MDYVDIDEWAEGKGLTTEVTENGVLIWHPDLGELGRCWFIGRAWMWMALEETSAARIRGETWLKEAWAKEISRRTREGAGVVA